MTCLEYTSAVLLSVLLVAGCGGSADDPGGSDTNDPGWTTAGSAGSGPSGGSGDVGAGNAGGSSNTTGGSAGSAGSEPPPDPPQEPTGDGFRIDGVCHPPCSDASTADAEGWGWENERTCVLAGSETAARALPCIPEEPPIVIDGPIGGGECPPDDALVCPDGASCGCYLVEGLGVNKAALLMAGAQRYMLAAAMMETDVMDAAAYAYGDGKTGDAFNAGVAKQNWLMMRHCHPAWTGLSSSDYATGAALNTDLGLDVQVFEECRAHYGDQWWAGHRGGQSGLEGGHDQSDIDLFKGAMDWTDAMLEGHLTDDVRFWVDVTPI